MSMRAGIAKAGDTPRRRFDILFRDRLLRSNGRPDVTLHTQAQHTCRMSPKNAHSGQRAAGQLSASDRVSRCLFLRRVEAGGGERFPSSSSLYRLPFAAPPRL
jgi:hypothetical protein